MAPEPTVPVNFPCETCGGRGRVPYSSEVTGNYVLTPETTCPICSGAREVTVQVPLPAFRQMLDESS